MERRMPLNPLLGAMSMQRPSPDSVAWLPGVRDRVDSDGPASELEMARGGQVLHRIVLVDDHEVVRRGLSQLIGGHPDFEVVADVGSAADALAAVSSLKPDLVLADLILGDGPDGIQLTRGIKAVHPMLPV